MPRKQKKYHYIYKTTCQITGKFYVGMHSTNNMDDGYLGSGKVLGYSRTKYGDENHIKEVLEYLPSREALRLREKEIVNEELLAHPLNINLKYGGEGGWDHLNNDSQVQRSKGLRGNARMKILRETSKDWVAKVSEKISIAQKEQYRLGERTLSGWSTAATLASTSPEAIQRRKQTMALNNHMQGSKNSMFGKRWVNKDNEIKLVNISSLSSYLEVGWVAGKIKRRVKMPKTEIKEREMIRKVLCSDVDVTIPGWPHKMSTILKMSSLGTKSFIKRCMPDFWQRCFIETNKRRY